MTGVHSAEEKSLALWTVATLLLKEMLSDRPAAASHALPAHFAGGAGASANSRYSVTDAGLSMHFQGMIHLSV